MQLQTIKTIKVCNTRIVVAGASFRIRRKKYLTKAICQENTRASASGETTAAHLLHLGLTDLELSTFLRHGIFAITLELEQSSPTERTKVRLEVRKRKNKGEVRSAPHSHVQLDARRPSALSQGGGGGG